MDELTKTEIENLENFFPTTAKKRRLILNKICSEIEKRHFKKLNEVEEDDLAKISELVFQLYPELSERTIRDYSRTSIKIWKLRQRQE